MVDDPGEYSWLSYACNAPGIKTELQTPHSEYLSLGKTKEERLENYRALFKAHVNAELWKEIRGSVSKGLALGSERFTAKIEVLTDRLVTPGKGGRPEKIIEMLINVTLTPIISNRYTEYFKPNVIQPLERVLPGCDY